MIDVRIYTFLKLCELMNYRKTAEALNMTQPAVTQHIKHLENLYNCKLFDYKSKMLSKTDAALMLEQHARSILYNDISFKSQINCVTRRKISIGATKTIGDFIINDLILSLLQDETVELNLIVDNTEKLFDRLNAFELDFLMIEGYFDKSQYDYKLIRDEELVGICSLDHRFAGRDIELAEVFSEHLILRESGSGTRAVMEHFLLEKNSSYGQMKKLSSISSFNLIQEAVENDIAISFVYDSIARKNRNLATFRIRDSKITHELNYAFLKNSKVRDYVDYIDDNYLDIEKNT